MTLAAPASTGKSQRVRVDSIDAFRGLTIALMIFVIAVAAGHYPELPQKSSWFGSLPISTWNHADVGWEKFVEAKSAAGLTEAEIELLPEAKLKKYRFDRYGPGRAFFYFYCRFGDSTVQEPLRYGLAGTCIQPHR